jgi:hypothetical protein
LSGCLSGALLSDQKMNYGGSTAKNNMKKARYLEQAVLNSLLLWLLRELGKPTDEELFRDPLWFLWKRGHSYKLHYHMRPQTGDTGDQPLPDFILEVDGKKRLAIECKNYSPTSKWSVSTATRDIERRFKWLPDDCNRVLLASHLQANGAEETARIHRRLKRARIKIYELGHFFCPESWKEVEAELGPMTAEWLGFLRRTRRWPQRKVGDAA